MGGCEGLTVNVYKGYYQGDENVIKLIYGDGTQLYVVRTNCTLE